MNIQDYITSGVLELYVLGSLSSSENEEVRKNAELYPKIAEEIKKIEEILLDYSSANAPKPRPELKNKIMDAIDLQEKVNSKTNTPSPVVRNIAPSGPSPAFYWAAAAVGAVLLTGNIFFYGQWKKAENEISMLNSRNDKLVQEYQMVKNEYNHLAVDYRILNNPDLKQVPLSGSEVSPDSRAVVYWNTKAKKTFIRIGSLPQPSQDEQYQLWALVDGKPVDAGVFETGTAEFQEVKDVENAQAFAVTLERRGGSDVPTLEKMFLIGKLN